MTITNQGSPKDGNRCSTGFARPPKASVVSPDGELEAERYTHEERYIMPISEAANREQQKQMSIGSALLQELEQEATTTRRVLERVPDAQLTWKPHAKSWSLG